MSPSVLLGDYTHSSSLRRPVCCPSRSLGCSRQHQQARQAAEGKALNVLWWSAEREAGWRHAVLTNEECHRSSFANFERLRRVRGWAITPPSVHYLWCRRSSRAIIHICCHQNKSLGSLFVCCCFLFVRGKVLNRRKHIKQLNTRSNKIFRCIDYNFNPLFYKVVRLCKYPHFGVASFLSGNPSYLYENWEVW